MSSQINFFNILPKDTGLYIFSQLDEESLHQVSFVSKRCLALANDDILWKRSLIQRSMEPIAECKKELIKFYEAFIKCSFALFPEESKNIDKSPADVFAKKKQITACILKNVNPEELTEVLSKKLRYPPIVPLEKVYTLIELGAKPTFEELNSCTPFTLKIFKILINAGARPNSRTVDRVLCKHSPVEKTEVLAFTKLLLAATTSLSVENLTNALINKHSPDVIKALLEEKTPVVDDALEIALRFQHPAQVIKGLLAVNPKVSNDALRLALERADKECLELILEADIKPTVEELECAVKRAPKFIQKLLNHGLKPTTKMLEVAIDDDSTYMTETLEFLIKAGAKVENVLIERAIKHCYHQAPKIIPILLKAGAIVSDQALKAAVERGNSEIFKIVVERAYGPSSEVMYAAVKSEFLEPSEIKMLFEINPDLTEEVLLTAVEQDRESSLEIIELLIEAGAQPTEKVLQAASKHRNAEKILECLNKKAKKDKNGISN